MAKSNEPKGLNITNEPAKYLWIALKNSTRFMSALMNNEPLVTLDLIISEMNIIYTPEQIEFVTFMLKERAEIISTNVVGNPSNNPTQAFLLRNYITDLLSGVFPAGMPALPEFVITGEMLPVFSIDILANLHLTTPPALTILRPAPARLLARIAATVLRNEHLLKMNAWHSSCGTAHCLAGWATALSEKAESIEAWTTTEVAGLLTLGSQAHAYFYSSDVEALEFLRSIHAGELRHRRLARLERLKAKSRFIADSLETWNPENLDGTLTTAYYAVKFSLFNKRGNAWLDYTILRSAGEFTNEDTPHIITCEYKTGKSSRVRTRRKTFASTFEFEKAILRLERAARRQNRHKTAVQAYIF